MSWTHDLAWAAGFFDGEGHFGAHLMGNGTPGLQARVSQVDRRPLDRFAAAVGGNVYGPYTYKTRPGKPHQPYYQFSAKSFEHSQAIIAMLWKFLSGPKRDQAKKALAVWSACPRQKPGRKRRAA